MHVLITAATVFEIQIAIDFFRHEARKYVPHKISFLITGVGSAPTAYSLTKEILTNRPDIALQAGIAGSFKVNCLTETYLVKEDKFADIGAIENNVFKTIFDMKLADENDFPFSKGVLINPNQNLLNIAQLPNAKAMTVNVITTEKKQIKTYRQNHSVTVESMEGAAFHYVCLMENIRFLQIRTVSNDIGERDKTKWKLNEAVAALNEKLILITKEILRQYEI